MFCFGLKKNLWRNLRKRGERKRKLPSVLSSQECQTIKLEEEEAKKLQEDFVMRKKLRLENQILTKLKKKRNEIRKRDEKVRIKC